MSAPPLLPTAGLVCVASVCLALAATDATESSEVAEPTDAASIETAPHTASVEPDSVYTERDVHFTNRGSGFRLAGTLAAPRGSGPFPGVVLVSGSGSQDRDETVGRVRPFRALADGLARQGIVVLRFDDRGAGESEGDPVELSGATTVELATDAQAAVHFLATQPEVAPHQIGVVGHSEGALIAPIVANDNSELVSFVVLLAGPAVPGAEILERQTTDVLTAEGAPAEIVDWVVGWTRQMIGIATSDLTASEAMAAMREVADAAITSAPPGAITGDPTAGIDATISAFTDPWMRFFLGYDPTPALADIDVPVLALLGDLDVQVAADVNAPATEAALANNPDATVVTLDGLNHLFQPATTGAISEYDTLDQPFPAETITLITDWIHTRTETNADPASRTTAATESHQR
jgi:dienelactone hydrolase